MIKLSKQSLGKNEMAVLIEGETREEIVQRFWSFVNHMATDGGFAMSGKNPFYHENNNGENGLEWVVEDFSAYFMTTPEKCIKAMKSAALFEIFQNEQWVDEPTLRQIVASQMIGKKRYDEMPNVVITDFEPQIAEDKFLPVLNIDKSAKTAIHLNNE